MVHENNVDVVIVEVNASGKQSRLSVDNGLADATNDSVEPATVSKEVANGLAHHHNV
jgi:hypothetical protein